MSRKNFLEALSGKRGSQPVFGSGTSMICWELMEKSGAGFPQAHVDAEVMAELALSGHTLAGFDVVMPLFSVCHEAAAMGCNVNWGGHDSMPESGPAIFRDVDDIRIPPDMLSKPSCQVPLKAISLLKKRLGDEAAVCGKVFGSWTQSYHYFGLENFLIWSLEDPAKVHRILEKLIPVTVQFANAQVDAGADCITLADHVTRDLCSPSAYRDFVLPIHQRLSSEIKAPVILHTCGNTSDRIPYIAKSGLACFHWDTKTGTAAEARKLAGDRISLMGGISNHKLLKGKPEEIAADAAEAFKAGIEIVGPECAIPLGTPLENLKTIASIRR